LRETDDVSRKLAGNEEEKEKIRANKRKKKKNRGEV